MPNKPEDEALIAAVAAAIKNAPPCPKKGDPLTARMIADSLRRLHFEMPARLAELRERARKAK